MKIHPANTLFLHISGYGKMGDGDEVFKLHSVFALVDQTVVV